VHLVQLLLPVYDNEGRRVPDDKFAEVRRELTAEFGGVTAYLRSPATGLWQRESGEVDRDEMVMFETMVDRLDPGWWKKYRSDLEERFSQEVIVARAIAMVQL
jgi:hypothetical protein